VTNFKRAKASWCGGETASRRMVLDEGFAWNGTTYRSLTEIAYAMDRHPLVGSSCTEQAVSARAGALTIPRSRGRSRRGVVAFLWPPGQTFHSPAGGFAAEADGSWRWSFATTNAASEPTTRQPISRPADTSPTISPAIVQGVFDGPVRADHRAEGVGKKHQRGNVEARLVRDLAVDFALAFDHHNGLEARPLVARG
jgi:hypothetical protein